jgi:hypothetical protein
VLIFVAKLLIRSHRIFLELPVCLHASSRGIPASVVHEACPLTARPGEDLLKRQSI